MTKTSSCEHRRFQVNYDWSKCHYIGISCFGSHVTVAKQFRHNILVDALKQTESMLNVPNE